MSNLSAKQRQAATTRQATSASYRWHLFLAASLVLTAACSTTPSDPLHSVSGMVSKVHDGDSIHITPPNQKRVVIRFSAIDAPELKQNFGLSSRDYLRSLLMGKQATAKCHKTDRYQRNVCAVYHNENDIGLKMIESGFAWHYKKYQNEQTSKQRAQYRHAEIRAKNLGRGLWQQDMPIAPWEFRTTL